MRSLGIESRGNGRLFALVVAAETVLAGILAGVRLGDKPLDRDEVVSVSVAQRGVSDMADVFSDFDANMALYYYALHGWLELGSSEGRIRLLSVLFAVAAVPLLAVLARRLFDERVGMIAGLVLAVNGFFVFWAQTARGYPLALFFAVLATYLFVRWVERPSRGLLAAYVVVGVVLVYLSLFAILVIAAHAVSVAFLPGRIPRRPLVLAQGAVAVLCAPLALWLLARGSRQAGGTPDFTVTIVGRAGLDLTGSCSVGCADDSPPLNAYPLFLLVVVCVLVGAIACWRGWRADPGTLRGWAQLLTVTWLVLPPLVEFVVSWVKPFFLATYLIGILPAIAILAGVGITTMAKRSRALAVAVAAALVALSLVEVVQYHRAPYKGDDLRAAARYVAEQAEPGDAIAYAPAWSRTGFRHYLVKTEPGARVVPDDIALAPGGLPEQVGDLWAKELETPVVSERLAEQRRVWVVGYPDSDWHPTPEPVIAAQKTVLARDFERVSSQTFGELTVDLYERS